MRKFIYEGWNAVMNHNMNPLKNIKDTNTRHMIMQILSWMWCIIFSMWFGSMWVFGVTAIAHLLILAGVVITVITFKTAKRKPSFFIKNLKKK